MCGNVVVSKDAVCIVEVCTYALLCVCVCVCVQLTNGDQITFPTAVAVISADEVCVCVTCVHDVCCVSVYISCLIILHVCVCVCS